MAYLAHPSLMPVHRRVKQLGRDERASTVLVISPRNASWPVRYFELLPPPCRVCFLCCSVVCCLSADKPCDFLRSTTDSGKRADEANPGGGGSMAGRRVGEWLMILAITLTTIVVVCCGWTVYGGWPPLAGQKEPLPARGGERSKAEKGAPAVADMTYTPPVKPEECQRPSVEVARGATGMGKVGSGELIGDEVSSGEATTGEVSSDELVNGDVCNGDVTRAEGDGADKGIGGSAADGELAEGVVARRETSSGEETNVKVPAKLFTGEVSRGTVLVDRRDTRNAKGGLGLAAHREVAVGKEMYVATVTNGEVRNGHR